MKRAFFLLLFGSMFFRMMGQEILPEWVKYTYGGYFYNIQSDKNVHDLSETAFKQYLVDVARTNLAKTVQTRVEDEALMHKQAVDGRSHAVYVATTRFSTDVDLRFVETESRYDPVSKTAYAIAYIEKQAACRYYQTELQMLFGKLENARSLAENYVATGFKAKAKECLEAVLPVFEQMETPFFWLGFFGFSQTEIKGYVTKRNAMEQDIRQAIADLEHGTRIYLSCSAYLGEQTYHKLSNELKGILSAQGCSFVSSPEQADWVIEVLASSRDYNHHQAGNYVTYFSYVDVEITIDKVATRQRIFADEISVKGGHTLNFTEAARAAYKDVAKEIGKTIKDIINK